MYAWDDDLVINFNEDMEYEKLCRSFCFILSKIGSIKNERERKMNIDLVEAVLEVLNRQFTVKIQKQL